MEKEKFIQKLMDEYNDRYNKDKKGIPVLYYFYGESGCGKSYLSYEFARTFDLIPYSTYMNNSILDRKVLRKGFKYFVVYDVSLIHMDDIMKHKIDKFINKYADLVSVIVFTSVSDPAHIFKFQKDSDEERDFYLNFIIHNIQEEVYLPKLPN